MITVFGAYKSVLNVTNKAFAKGLFLVAEKATNEDLRTYAKASGVLSVRINGQLQDCPSYKQWLQHISSEEYLNTVNEYCVEIQPVINKFVQKYMK